MASAGKADAAATTCSSADSSCVLKVEAATATISNGAAGQSYCLQHKQQYAMATETQVQLCLDNSET